ncbi:MAG: tRNA dihydrouridine synthase [Candidatus Dojkabacteria bacterium]
MVFTNSTNTNTILALAPMDGVTDVAYREVVARYGAPDLMYTEFIAVEGIVRISERLLPDFWYTPAQRPVLAQIYGNDPELFYASTQLACELGFDGIDINMGCPAKRVVHRGCGAGLICNPTLAKEIVFSCKRAVKDWAEGGINWKNWPVISGDKAKKKFESFIASSLEKPNLYADVSFSSNKKREPVPVSIKTRIGYDQPVTESWIEELLETNPAAIAIHGRTLKQAYAGKANWGEIIKAKILRDELQMDQEERTLILGNGDIKSKEDISPELDGVLIGRGTFGKPWVFEEIRGKTVSHNSSEVILEHVRLHELYKPERSFPQMRKNLAWYVGGFHGASELRSKLVRSSSATEVADILAASALAE